MLQTHPLYLFVVTLLSAAFACTIICMVGWMAGDFIPSQIRLIRSIAKEVDDPSGRRKWAVFFLGAILMVGAVCLTNASLSEFFARLGLRPGFTFPAAAGLIIVPLWTVIRFRQAVGYKQCALVVIKVLAALGLVIAYVVLANCLS